MLLPPGQTIFATTRRTAFSAGVRSSLLLSRQPVMRTTTPCIRRQGDWGRRALSRVGPIRHPRVLLLTCITTSVSIRMVECPTPVLPTRYSTCTVPITPLRLRRGGSGTAGSLQPWQRGRQPAPTSIKTVSSVIRSLQPQPPPSPSARGLQPCTQYPSNAWWASVTTSGQHRTATRPASGGARCRIGFHRKLAQPLVKIQLLGFTPDLDRALAARCPLRERFTSMTRATSPTP